MIEVAGAKVSYVPALKTRDAELRAYEELSYSAKSGCLPLFELTKSRVTTKNPDGTIYRRMSDIFERLPSSMAPLVLDLTDVPHLQNKEIVSFFDYEGGFANWCDFLYQFRDRNIVPCLHFVLDDEGENQQQINTLLDAFAEVCVRVKIGEDYTNLLIDDLISKVPEERLIVVIDASYVHIDHFLFAEAQLADAIRRVKRLKPNCKIVTLVSTFPSFVLRPGYGEGDSAGSFEYREFTIWENLSRSLGFEITHGDYGSIHPIVENGGGGTFIPRIDYPTSNEFIYKRFRRNDYSRDGVAGYVRAARAMLADPRYLELGYWGTDMIHSAATGALPAKNPSFWISVRANLFMSRMFHRLSNDAML